MSRVSVVVCTRNRLASVKRCLQAFDVVQTDASWELIVIDNGSTDGTSDFLDSLPTCMGGGDLLLGREARTGVSRARNAGIDLARGEIIAFIDDDCYVAPDFVSTVADAFTSDPGLGFLAGRVLLFDKTDIHFTIKEDTRPASYPARTFLASGSVHGANMAFRREVLEHIGGFNDLFGPGSFFIAEDCVAAADALWSGFRGAYDPRPTVYHHHGRRTEADLRSVARNYDIGRGAYFARFILRHDSRRLYLKAWFGRVTLEKLKAFARKMVGLKPEVPTTREQAAWNVNPIDSRRGKLRIVGREIMGAIHYVWLVGGRSSSAAVRHNRPFRQKKLL
jgi:glycosyltransferase involved in cell wall biosynthesis